MAETVGEHLNFIQTEKVKNENGEQREEEKDDQIDGYMYLTE